MKIIYLGHMREVAGKLGIIRNITPNKKMVQQAYVVQDQIFILFKLHLKLCLVYLLLMIYRESYCNKKWDSNHNLKT